MQVQYKILVVDDEPITLNFIRALLEHAGNYVVKTAKSGEKTLEILAGFKPDVILLDIMIPIMDGYTICRKIRSDNTYRFTKIIMISGQCQVEKRLKGYEAGADDYIGKPFDSEELLAKLRVFTQLKNREEIDRIKGDVLTLITHETRTPVSGIISCAQLLCNDPSMDKENKELAALIVESGKQLFEFLKKAVLLCKLKAGLELHPHAEPVDVILSNVVNQFKQEYQQRDITIETDLGETVFLQADWPLLVNVFRFVIHNACKFSPEKGTVIIKSRSDDGVLIITVADEGPGVDPSLQEDIFDEFAIKDVIHHQKGQGISLAICRSILHYHHGTIEVKNNPAGGAVFIIKLPLQLINNSGERDFS